ncbi:MAG TPA: T9SS type A sorting domain-containing protein [Bacteroidia bacterium]|nr:T9SS type A sorting domain-containing protein [Bacteroidia bacterium]
MKKRLFFLASMLGAYTLSAQTFQPYTTRYGKPLNDAVYDSVYYRGLFGNPDSTTIYDENKRVNIVYNADHLEVSELEKGIDWWGSPGVWLNGFKHTFTYDANKRWVGKTTQLWNGSGYDNYQKFIITYNSNNKETSAIYQSWTEATSSWYSGAKDSIIYDGSGKILEAIHYGWNSLINNWEFDNKWAYTYSGNLIISSLYSRYDGSNWNPLVRYSFSYTGTNNDFVLGEYWTGQTWLKTGKFSYEFNEAGQVTKETLRSQQNSVWFKSNVNTNNYNANGILKKHTHKVWFGANDNSFSGNQQQYYLHHPQPYAAPLAGTSADKAKNDEVSIYPNPSSGIFNVKLPDNEQVKTIQVFNAVGEKVLEQSGSEVNLDSIAKGMYVVKIYNGENVYQEKMVIE